MATSQNPEPTVFNFPGSSSKRFLVLAIEYYIFAYVDNFILAIIDEKNHWESKNVAYSLLKKLRSGYQ